MKTYYEKRQQLQEIGKGIKAIDDTGISRDLRDACIDLREAIDHVSFFVACPDPVGRVVACDTLQAIGIDTSGK